MIVDEDVDVREQPRKPRHVGAVAEIGRVVRTETL
jgi:hypothetical protein